MKAKSLVDSARQAAADTARFITSDLRNHAESSGWDTDTAASMQVMFDGKGYKVEVAADFQNQAMTLEYGSEQQRPTGAVRKYANRTAQAEKVFISSLEKKIGMKLT